MTMPGDERAAELRPIKKRVWLVWYKGRMIGEPCLSLQQADAKFVEMAARAGDLETIMASGTVIEMRRVYRPKP